MRFYGQRSRVILGGQPLSLRFLKSNPSLSRIASIMNSDMMFNSSAITLSTLYIMSSSKLPSSKLRTFSDNYFEFYPKFKNDAKLVKAILKAEQKLE